MKRRGGLTLMELLVVLMILVALASLLIPMISNPMGRAHNSVGTVNMKEVTKNVQTYQTQYYTFPNGWDSLTSTTGLVDYLPMGTDPVSGDPALVSGDLTAGTLTEGEVNALVGVGIDRVHLMHPDASTGLTANPDFSPSFDPYVNPDPTSFTQIAATSTNLAILNTAKAVKELNASPTGRYVAFGLGQRCSIVGKTIAEAPVTFSDEPGANPTKTYVRFAVIFQVSDTATAITKAKLVGTLHIATGGLHGVNTHLKEYYDIDK